MVLLNLNDPYLRSKYVYYIGFRSSQFLLQVEPSQRDCLTMLIGGHLRCAFILLFFPCLWYVKFVFSILSVFYRWKIESVANILKEQVMAGSGHLQTFRLLRFLRSRNSVDGHANYGIQMAVSF